MSADRYSQCPKCVKGFVAEKEEKHRKSAEAYGKVTPGEWKKLVKEAESLDEPEETFRENWWLGMSPLGEFSIEYYGECTECGFSFSFKHEEIPLDK